MLIAVLLDNVQYILLQFAGLSILIFISFKL